MKKAVARQPGFTFIEVLVSLAIFAVISVICYSTVSQYLRVRDAVEQSNQEMRELQRLVTLLERDLRFVINRPVRDELGDQQAAFQFASDANLGEVFRATVSQPETGLPGKTRLTRIRWRLQDGDVYRDSWQVLDRVEDSLPQSRLLLRNVDSLEIIAWQWTDQRGLQSTFNTVSGSLPYAVELTLILENGEQYRRLFEIANGS